MPQKSGVSRRISSQTSDALAYAQFVAASGRPIFSRVTRARSVIIRQSGRASPGGGTATATRCTRRSVFVKVPSFSAKLAAGRITSA